jgi:hypothetical protein
MAGLGKPKTGGRTAGTPNKTTTALKEAIVLAATNAGGEGGMVGYLTDFAKNNPEKFVPLLAKMLPVQLDEDRRERLRGPIDLSLLS